MNSCTPVPYLDRVMEHPAFRGNEKVPHLVMRDTMQFAKVSLTRNTNRNRGARGWTMKQIESSTQMSACLRIFIESLLCEAESNSMVGNGISRSDKQRPLLHFGSEIVTAIAVSSPQPCPLLIQLDYSQFPGEQSCGIRKSIQSL
jgi:hypothetical protein